jgi:RNA-binding protein
MHGTEKPMSLTSKPLSSPLSKKQTRFLRSLSHHRKPVVIIGAAGLTQAVLDEIENAIAHHELIKVRVNASDKAARQLMIDHICSQLSCVLVFAIGHVATFYRRSKKRLIEIPNS